jgi:superfamily I DNA/RNA helicase
VFGGVWADLDAENRTTWAGLCRLATEQISQGRIPTPYDSVIVDEVQDLQPSAIQLVAALGGKGRDGIMLVGDAGQRIYPGGFSLRSLGIDVRGGRSRVLRINYRTTEEIQRLADRLLGSAGDDLDEGTESRRGTVSLLRGPEPTLQGFATENEERAFLADTVRSLVSSGLAPNEIAVFARTKRVGEQIVEGLLAANIPAQVLGEEDGEDEGADEAGVTVSTMHGAKGLEFKAVVVASCDDQKLPNAFVLKSLTDPQEREAAIAQERRLLYVSMTRARDEVFVTWTGAPSPFVQELLDARRPAA